MNNAKVPLFSAPMTDEMRARMDALRAEGFTIFDPEMQAAMPRLWHLYFQQPRGTPGAFPVPLNGLYDPPSEIASNARWRCWRDDMVAMAGAGDPNLAAFAQAAENLLSWRECLAPEDRFWKPDE